MFIDVVLVCSDNKMHNSNHLNISNHLNLNTMIPVMQNKKNSYPHTFSVVNPLFDTLNNFKYKILIYNYHLFII